MTQKIQPTQPEQKQPQQSAPGVGQSEKARESVNNAQVSAVKHKDIRGKELLYLVITTPNDTAIINIGEKTYDKMIKMGLGNKTNEQQQ